MLRHKYIKRWWSTEQVLVSVTTAKTSSEEKGNEGLMDSFRCVLLLDGPFFVTEIYANGNCYDNHQGRATCYPTNKCWINGRLHVCIKGDGAWARAWARYIRLQTIWIIVAWAWSWGGTRAHIAAVTSNWSRRCVWVWVCGRGFVWCGSRSGRTVVRVQIVIKLSRRTILIWRRRVRIGCNGHASFTTRRHISAADHTISIRRRAYVILWIIGFLIVWTILGKPVAEVPLRRFILLSYLTCHGDLRPPFYACFWWIVSCNRSDRRHN